MILALPIILTSLTSAIAAPPIVHVAPSTPEQLATAAAEREREMKAGRARGTAKVVNGVEVAQAFSYPVQALREEAEGNSVVEILVDREGGIEECIVLRSAGHAALDQAACTLFTRTARFEPARSQDGEAVLGVYRQVVVWRIPNKYPEPGAKPTPPSQ